MADEVRLIDAELLTTDIAQIAKNCARSDAQKALIGRILFMIENMPTIEVEPDNGWISVEDRLPDKVEEVLIYCPEFLETIRKDLYTEDDFYVEEEGMIVKPAPNGYCTHWQPLPKPPKGE